MKIWRMQDGSFSEFWVSPRFAVFRVAFTSNEEVEVELITQLASALQMPMS